MQTIPFSSEKKSMRLKIEPILGHYLTAFMSPFSSSSFCPCIYLRIIAMSAIQQTTRKHDKHNNSIRITIPDIYSFLTWKSCFCSFQETVKSHSALCSRVCVGILYDSDQTNFPSSNHSILNRRCIAEALNTHWFRKPFSAWRKSPVKIIMEQPRALKRYIRYRTCIWSMSYLCRRGWDGVSNYLVDWFRSR